MRSLTKRNFPSRWYDNRSILKKEKSVQKQWDGIWYLKKTIRRKVTEQWGHKFGEIKHRLILTSLTVDFCPFRSVIVWGPIPWQHSWQIVWVKKDSKSTKSRCSSIIHTSAIGLRISLNLIKEPAKVHNL